MAKRHLENINTYQPGKPIEEVKRELGLKDVIKLASNENPLGSSPKAISAIKKNLDKINYYPDGNSVYLKKLLERKWGMEREHFIVGNGSDEIAMLAAAVFLEEGNEAIIGWPSFVIYPLVIKKFGGKVISVKLKDFHFDLKAMARAVTEKTKLIFIANPNNPTGTIVVQKEVNKFLDEIPETVLIVFDEAYAEFVDDPFYPQTINLVKKRQNVLMLRTFSKCYGLAGLRIGYGIGSKETITYLDKMREPFNVNSIAQIAAAAALEDSDFLVKTKEVVQSGRTYLYQELAKRKINYIPSSANFILIKVSGGGKTVFNKLLKEGIIVRALDEYGLEDYIRVTIGTPKENRRFIQAMDKTLIKKRAGR